MSLLNFLKKTKTKEEHMVEKIEEKKERTKEEQERDRRRFFRVSLIPNICTKVIIIPEELADELTAYSTSEEIAYTTACMKNLGAVGTSILSNFNIVNQLDTVYLEFIFMGNPYTVRGKIVSKQEVSEHLYSYGIKFTSIHEILLRDNLIRDLNKYSIACKHRCLNLNSSSFCNERLHANRCQFKTKKKIN